MKIIVQDTFRGARLGGDSVSYYMKSRETITRSIYVFLEPQIHDLDQLSVLV